jgi:hypothetical protein
LIGLVAVSLLFSFADVYWPSFVSSIFVSTEVAFLLIGSVMLFISAITRGERTPRWDYAGSKQVAADSLWLDKLARLGEDLKRADSSLAALNKETTR